MRADTLLCDHGCSLVDLADRLRALDRERIFRDALSFFALNENNLSLFTV